MLRRQTRKKVPQALAGAAGDDPLATSLYDHDDSGTFPVMSRRRSAPSVNRAEQAAHDVLAGRISIGAGELLEHIHAINPTGRSLGVADERRRYELKARLQSLLIRKFHDDLVVTADARSVVAIRHRYLGQDACHARIDELEEDARARVQWLLDVAEVDEPAGGGMAMPSDPTTTVEAGPLAQGRAALAEFDYDAARAHFEQAAVGANGDPTAARELLELLVDQLALDEEALAFEHRLPERAAADADVRALLAVAASRTGNAAAAQRLLSGLVGPRAADAWCALAEDAVRQKACDDLDRCLARLIEVDPAHPEVVRLRGEANHLRADERRPAEQELLQIAGDANDAAVEAAARRLLARWPDSPVAGRILGRIQDHRRSTEIERLVASTRAALSEGEVGRATELCRQARAAGADTQALLEQIREVEAAQRRAREDAELAAVCTQLAGVDPRPGLTAFLALGPELRRRVRTQVDLPMLEWLDQASARHKGTRHAAIIDAVLAIASADGAFARGDDDQALAILEPHGPLIAGVARASELRAEAQRRIAARRRDAATAALAEAQHALAAGDLERCERLCDHTDRRDLDAAQRPALDQVRHALRERRDVVRRRARIDQLAASGDLVTARRELEGLIAQGPTDDDHAVASHARLDALRAELRRAWCIRSDDAGGRRDHPDPVGELLGPLPYTEGIAPWLVAGGRELVVATTQGPHVFLGRVSVDDGRLLDRRYLRAPEPLGELCSATVDGDTVWLADQAGRVLQVSWTTGEPVRWLSLAAFLKATERIERVFLLPGCAHLWFDATLPGDEPAARVIEVETWRLRREIPTSRYLQPLAAGAASCVFGMVYDGGAVRYTERGALVEEIAACAGMRVASVTVAPDGGLVILGARFDEAGEPGGVEILTIQMGRTIHRQALPEASSERAMHCASARGPGLLVVHHRVDVDVARLVGLRFGDPELAPIYAVRAPTDMILAQDGDATQVVGLWDSPRGVEVARLDAQPPSFDDAAFGHGPADLPALTGYFSCRPTKTEAGDGGVLLVADQAAARRDWNEVRTLLEEVPLDSVAPSLIAHHCHLLGIAWLRTGAEAARVQALWKAGLPREQEADRYFTCRLDACLELVEPMPDPLPAEWWNADVSPIRQLRGAIATADRLLAAGSAQAALEVMRRRVVTRTRELQSTARLAAAWLAIDPHHPGDCFDKAIALARFVALTTCQTSDLPVQGAFRPEQLTAIAGRAEQWLTSWHERVCPAGTASSTAT